MRDGLSAEEILERAAKNAMPRVAATIMAMSEKGNAVGLERAADTMTRLPTTSSKGEPLRLTSKRRQRTCATSRRRSARKPKKCSTAIRRERPETMLDVEEKIAAVAAMLLGSVNAPEREIWNVSRAIVTMIVRDYEDALRDNRDLVRRLDVALNGRGAARQASLCDLIAQFEKR